MTYPLLYLSCDLNKAHRGTYCVPQWMLQVASTYGSKVNFLLYKPAFYTFCEPLDSGIVQILMEWVK